MFNPKKALENNQAPKDSGEKKYELLPEGRYTFT
jgi:hypothetical protein